MKATNKDGKIVLQLNETLSITLGDEVYPQYLGGFVEPNNWVVCPSTGSDSKYFEVYYYVEDPNIPLDEIDIDFESPDFIYNEIGCVVYNPHGWLF